MFVLGWVFNGKLCNIDTQPLVLASKRTLKVSQPFMYYIYIYIYIYIHIHVGPCIVNRI